MKTYKCFIYCYNYATEHTSREDWKTTQLSCSSQSLVEAWSKRHAAAIAYVKDFGELRSALFERLGGMEVAVQFEASVEQVGRTLQERICHCGPCYYFDNGVEIFYTVLYTPKQLRRLVEMQKAAVRVMCFN